MAWIAKINKRIEEEELHEVVIPNPIIGYWAVFFVKGLLYRQWVPGDGLEDTYTLKRLIRSSNGLAEDQDIRLVPQHKVNN